LEFKINHTNSLSAARYFGSFGIQNFGFSLDALNPNHVSIHEAKQIIGWLYQPNIILEVGIFQKIEELDFLKEEIGFTSVEISIHHPELDKIVERYKQNWIKMNFKEMEQFDFETEKYQESIFIIEIQQAENNTQKIQQTAKNRLIFLDIKDGINTDEMIQNSGISNLCIPCRKEVSVGNFDIEPYERFLPYLEGMN